MWIKKLYNKNQTLFLIPFFTVITFLTWFFKLNEFINLGIYTLILIILVKIKANNLNLVIFSIFTVMANYSPDVFPTLDKWFFEIFGINITALRSYYNFLYLYIFSLVAIIMFSRYYEKGERLGGKLRWSMIALTVYSFITLFWASNLVRGLSEITFFIQGYIAYLGIKNDKEEKNIFYELSWFLTLILLIISSQYAVIYYKFPGPDKQPLYHMWANPNIVAAVFGIAFVPSLYKYFVKGKSILRFIYLPVELFIIYGIVVSKSSGLHLAIIGTLILSPLLLINNKKVLYGTIFTVLLFFVLVTLSLVVFELPLNGIYRLFDKLTTGRLNIYKVVYNLLKKPAILILGRGVGYDRMILPYATFHSFIFQIIVNRGLFSFIMYIMMYAVIVNILFESRDKFRYFATIGIMMYLLHALTDTGFEYQYIGVLFFIIIASIERNNVLDLKNDLLLIH